MANKENALWIPEKESWQIQYRTADGSLKVRDTVPMIHRLKTGESLKAMAGWAKSQDTLREAAVSLLADVLAFGGNAVGAYRGVCDPAKNLPDELGKSFRTAEEAYFRQFMDEKHELHAQFVKQLPSVNERKEKLEVGGKLNPERQFMYYLTALRKAPSYTNAKTVVLSYWGYCGKGPVALDGDGLVPPEVMRVEVANVRTVAGPDNSVRAKLYAIRKEIMTESKFPPDEDMPEIVATLRDLLHACEVLETSAAKRRTIRPQPGDVSRAAADAIAQASAQKTLDSVKNPPEAPADEQKPDSKPVTAGETEAAK